MNLHGYFKCRHCGQVMLREMVPAFMTPSGRYKSYCQKVKKNTFLERVDGNEHVVEEEK